MLCQIDLKLLHKEGLVAMFAISTFIGKREIEKIKTKDDHASISNAFHLIKGTTLILNSGPTSYKD